MVCALISSLSILTTESPCITSGLPPPPPEDGDETDVARRHVAQIIGLALQAKEEVLDLYCPSMDTIQHRGLITAGVILPNATPEDVERWFPDQRLHDLGFSRKHKELYPVVAADALERASCESVFPRAHTRNERMNLEIAMEFRWWLRFPGSVQSEPLELEPWQKKIAWATAGGYRRVKGAAGCGKSVLVAHRAVRLAMEGKRVLVLAFNITMVRYLMKLGVGAAKSIPSVPAGWERNLAWLHYHEWAKRVCYENGFRTEYKSLWKRGDDAWNQIVLEEKLPDLVEEVLEHCQQRGEQPQEEDAALVGERPERSWRPYDAVLVDEGQDFRPNWWANLRDAAISEGADMLLVVDPAQDVYGRSTLWTDKAMTGSGFSGAWPARQPSYRLPQDMIPYIHDFAKRFFPADNRLHLPIEVHTGTPLPFKGTEMRWIQVDEDESPNTCAKEVKKLSEAFGNAYEVWEDMVFLASSREDGLIFVDRMKQLGFPIHHTFVCIPDKPTEEKIRARYKERQRKRGFAKDTPRIKATTIQSFKGWECSWLIVQLSDRNDPEALAAVYTALTRLKQRRNGSYITVVSSWESGVDYGKTWPHFEDRRAGASAGTDGEPPPDPPATGRRCCVHPPGGVS